MHGTIMFMSYTEIIMPITLVYIHKYIIIEKKELFLHSYITFSIKMTNIRERRPKKYSKYLYKLYILYLIYEIIR